MLVVDHSKSRLALPNVSNSQNANQPNETEQLEVGVEVLPILKSGKKQTSVPVMWNFDKFMVRLYLMREMYDNFVHKGGWHVYENFIQRIMILLGTLCNMFL